MGKRELERVEEELQTAVDMQIINENCKNSILRAYKEFKGDSKYIMLYLEELYKLFVIRDYTTISYLKSALTTIHELFKSGYHIEY